MDLIGSVLGGRYRIVEKIGRGGMAAVFKAYQPALDRYVAIKVLPAQHAETPGFSERFAREARAVAQLNHPNILPVIDFGQENGLSFIVMKFVAGGTLKDRLSQPINLNETARIVEQIAAALDHAHQHGILHRDVKSSNVLLDEGGWVQLADFGLAKMLSGDEGLTATGVGIGTPAYMSPEQGQGLAVDQRTDVYSLGVLLYEMAAGRLPYDAETPMAIVFKHIYEPLPLPRRINPALPEEVERIILKAMAKSPADRYASAGALAQALQQAVTHLSAVADTGPAKTSPAVDGTRQVSLPPAPPVASQVTLTGRGGPLWAMLAGGLGIVLASLVLLLVAGVIGYLALRGGSSFPALAAVFGRATATPTAEPTQTPPGDESVTPEPTVTPTEDAQAYVEQGQAALTAGDVQSAVEHFGQAIELDSTSAAAYVGRGDAYSQLADYESALSDYTRAIELDPGNAQAYAGRGGAYYNLDDAELAIADCDRAIELDPQAAIAFYNRGLAYASQEDYKRALADYTQAIQLRSDYASAYYRRGNVYDAQEDYERAVADYTQAIKLKPDDASALFDRGVVFHYLEKYDQAIADYTQVIRIEPDNVLAYTNRGLAYEALDRPDKAMADYTQAIQIKPDYADAYHHRGDIYYDREDDTKALADYTVAIQLKPESDDASTYYNDRGRTYYRQENYAQAIADYSESIRLDPNDDAAYYNRGLAYDAQEDYERAIADYTQALKLEPDDALTYGNRGNAYYGQKDYEKAIADYTQAIQLKSDYALAYYNRGIAYTDTGQKDKAIADFKRALELSDDTDLRADAEEQLRQLGQ